MQLPSHQRPTSKSSSIFFMASSRNFTFQQPSNTAWSIKEEEAMAEWKGVFTILAARKCCTIQQLTPSIEGEDIGSSWSSRDDTRSSASSSWQQRRTRPAGNTQRSNKAMAAAWTSTSSSVHTVQQWAAHTR
ncbi:hypothetical protein VIGAN_11168700 [Vigna angularis var. angularis]|uniref:Uncharacterized protein n=1 Tax=Vigna angularis var. angularis TaxID=157739 RepID=A0A0S3TBE0_PHAAN|nr:hypothetical protein VIGAN_11168700 [Vigna angularis var. angularis]